MADSKNGLTVSLPSDREIELKRVFDAPRELVFEAFTSCEHMRRWLGPRDMTMVSCEIDFRPGGAYRYVHRAPDGTEHGFRGEHREIVPPERIVNTFEYEGVPGHIAIQTATFDEKDGKTTFTVIVLFDSVEDRDGMLASGMESGAAESYDRLAEYLKTMA
jgi:uncharacterized protein YndB with AHSA1/START domain